MSKFRAAAIGAAVFVGMAVSAGAQAPVKADSARSSEGTVRGERVEGMRKRHMERGMRGAHRRGMRHGAMHRGMKHRAMNRGMRGPGARGMRGFGVDLNLTDAQKTRIRAIHEKYQPQFRTLHEQNRAQANALRGARQQRDTTAAARQRFQQQRQQFRQRAAAIHQQQQNEIRAVLTAEQRAKVDAARNERAKRMEERAKQMQERARQLRSN